MWRKNTPVAGNRIASEIPPVLPWTERLARLAGLVLMLCGILALLWVMLEYWLLYQEPDRILPLAQAINATSRLDESLLGAAMANSGADGQGPLVFSYFLAWTLAIVLLAMIGRVAYWAIRAGGGLVATGSRSLGAQEHHRQRPAQEPVELPEDYRPSHRLEQTGGRLSKDASPSVRPRSTQ